MDKGQGLQQSLSLENLLNFLSRQEVVPEYRWPGVQSTGDLRFRVPVTWDSEYRWPGVQGTGDLGSGCRWSGVQGAGDLGFLDVNFKTNVPSQRAKKKALLPISSKSKGGKEASELEWQGWLCQGQRNYLVSFKNVENTWDQSIL